jgi:hypothetical protein
MAQPTTESIGTTLGGLRKKLIEEGFAKDEAFQLVLDLVRRGSDFPEILKVE